MLHIYSALKHWIKEIASFQIIFLNMDIFAMPTMSLSDN